jgi:hypothetical protein
MMASKVFFATGTKTGTTWTFFAESLDQGDHGDTSLACGNYDSDTFEETAVDVREQGSCGDEVRYRVEQKQPAPERRREKYAK